MRPVRLTLQAFGPYAGREVVDFRAAVAAGLFGVYGQTGAGKSTIFSAMSFALFGEPARAEQDAKSLRSDHAPADLPTEVEFVFELGARTYLVRRRPGQSRPKQRGEGETWDNPEAWVFDATGVALDALGAASPGKVLAEKKLGLVAQVIDDLLGYGLEQFRQIVLLPQGRFETFLAAKTDERVKILRELFDVSLYRSLAAKLKSEAEEAEKEFTEIRAVSARQLSLEGFESLDALDAGIVAAEAVLAKAEAESSEANAAAGAARARHAEARTVVGLFDAEVAARAAHAALDEATEAMNALAARTDMAETARGAQDLEAAWQNEAREHGRAVEAARRAETAAREAAADLRTAQEALEAAKGKEDERTALNERLGTLKRHAGKLDGSADLARAHRDAGVADQKARGAAQAAAGEVKRLAGSKRACEAELKSAREVQDARQKVANRLRDAQAKLKHAEKVADAISAIDRARQSRDAGKEKLVIVEEKAATAKAALDEAEARLSRTQAIILAEKLVAGAPCPVCGAHDHPAPAHGDKGQSGLTETFRRAERAHADTAAEVSKAAMALATAEGVLTERLEAAGQLEAPEGEVEELRDRVGEASRELDDLGAAVDIGALEAALESLGTKLALAETTRVRLQGVADEAQATFVEARARHDAAIADIPDGLRERGALSAETARVARDLTELVEALNRAQEAERNARESELGARKDAEAAGEKVADLVQRRADAERAFLARLEQRGLDRERYEALKPAFGRIEEDRQKVADHRERLLEARTRCTDAAQAIAGRERPDLLPLEEAVEAAGEVFDAATKAAADARAQSEKLIGLRRAIEETYARVARLEAETGPLRELAQRLDGRNELKLDLETFAIGAMFDRVLDAANLRLVPMTQGRYRLERALEVGGRGRRGLEIQAHDINTGKSRPTSTLSGGETFIAALALALGLADVVESLNGKVRMDTIFIDEGFGSLDTENGAGTLDQVLQVLSHLVRDNRAVGLISHVSLVQEAIPNGFYVWHGPAGSHVEERAGF